MKRNLSDLLRNNEVKAVKPDEEQAKDCIAVAERDLKASLANLKMGEFDWAFAVAYNAMIQATRALMLAEGYAPVGEAHHKAVVDYAWMKLGASAEGEAEFFEHARKKRHHVVYDKAGTVTRREAEEALTHATKLVAAIKNKLKR